MPRTSISLSAELKQRMSEAKHVKSWSAVAAAAFEAKLAEGAARAINPSCDQCRFWEVVVNNRGDCHRFPPTTVAYETKDREVFFDDFLPTTKSDEWCGEFKPKEPTP